MIDNQVIHIIYVFLDSFQQYNILRFPTYFYYSNMK